MESKAIIYIIMGVVYLLYSLYQKGIKEQEKKAPENPTRKSVSPPTKSIFEQALEEIKQQAAARELATNSSKSLVTEKKKELLVQQKVNPQFEEGKTAFNLYEREMTAEENRATEAERKRVIVASKAFDIPEEEETGISFDARQALISSVIFERKF